MTTKPRVPIESMAVVLHPLALHQVRLFRERYAQYQACEDTAESQALGNQVDDLAFKLAFSLESIVENVEAEQQGAEESPICKASLIEVEAIAKQK